MHSLRSILLLSLSIWFTQAISQSTNPISPAGMTEIGQLKTRSSKDIPASTWSVGGETLDRDYADYQEYKKYLGPIGAKRVRFQAGWAKCEKVKGHYDFAWIDATVDDALKQGVQPWLQTSYGNALYPGGGEAKLGGRFPTTPETLVAWNNWVKALTVHFKGRIKEWEVWNEPNNNPENTPAEYANLYIQTTETIRSVIPNATVFALAFAHIDDYAYVDDFLAVMKQRNKLDLVEVLTIHGYKPVPEANYPAFAKIREVADKYNPGIRIMQGENGCPSTAKPVTAGALKEYDWSELTQAKWDLRRMLGDKGRDYETNVFTMADLYYKAGDDKNHVTGVVSHGLLESTKEGKIVKVKQAYYAVQRVMSLFDSQIERTKNFSYAPINADYSVFGFRQQKTGGSLVAVWNHTQRPADTFPAKDITLTVEKEQFQKPVYVDLVTGKIYRIPADKWSKKGTTHQFTIPVADYPVLIADQSVVMP